MHTAIQNNPLSLLGVNIRNYSNAEALVYLESLISAQGSGSNAIYIVNAHTLNLAVTDASYREVLNKAAAVFGDGTGVRWAARLRGVRMQDNLVGTDLIPRLFERNPGRGFRYFLLGADSETIEKAADVCQKKFPGWDQAGYHHGYVLDDERENEKAIALINAQQPDVLLVGMGNPKQEAWIHANQHKISVPACIGVGGLFDHWAGNLTRAPHWVRKMGYEWLQLLVQQPHKWRRYLVGNPTFILNMVQSLQRDKASMAADG